VAKINAVLRRAPSVAAAPYLIVGGRGEVYRLPIGQTQIEIEPHAERTAARRPPHAWHGSIRAKQHCRTRVAKPCFWRLIRKSIDHSSCTDASDKRRRTALTLRHHESVDIAVGARRTLADRKRR
jgi:hypothetical protein